jgi:rSAM/selenodomain-associated transferase 1
MSNNALIIFTRNPELGKCKTRLAKTIGDQEALNVYKHLLQHTANVAKKVKTSRYVYYSVKIRDNDIWDTKLFNKKQQLGEDLGVRMQNAFQELFNLGYDKVVIIGSDLLDLSAEIIEEAYKKLDTNDAVIGPAEDGGYYLLGFKKPTPEVFNIKNWGTETVYKQTIEKLISKKVYVLETLNDIDYVEDLKPYPRFASYFKTS